VLAGVDAAAIRDGSDPSQRPPEAIPAAGADDLDRLGIPDEILERLLGGLAPAAFPQASKAAGLGRVDIRDADSLGAEEAPAHPDGVAVDHEDVPGRDGAGPERVEDLQDEDGKGNADYDLGHGHRGSSWGFSDLGLSPSPCPISPLSETKVCPSSWIFGPAQKENPPAGFR
jgi:hypothetical protein